MTQKRQQFIFQDMINLFNPQKKETAQYNQRAWAHPNLPVNPPPSENKPNSQEGLPELINLLKNFVAESAKTKKQESADHLRQKYQIQARDKEVFLPLPEVSEKIEEKVLKKWIAEVTKTVFSSAFHEYSKANMSFEQTKIYCSENILKNLARLNQKYTLSPKQFEVINAHLVRRILPYLGEKYPLTDSTEINKKLLSIVEEIDNIEELQNNYFSHSKIMFEFRKEGNYYDLIMKVINDLLNKIDNVNQSGKTNFQDFEKFMTKVFEKAYDLQWINKTEELPLALLGECLKYVEPEITHKRQDKQRHVIRHESQTPEQRQGKKGQWQKDKQREKDVRRQQRKKKEQQDKQREKEARRQQKKKKEQSQKYKAAVKEYTSFLIGRKIPQNVPLFSEQEIGQNKLSIKHPAVLRILTKWFEELWKKFQKNYFINRSQNIKLQKGDSAYDLKPEYRRVIDNLMCEQKRKINYYIQIIQKLNYKLESSILKIEESFEGEDEMEELQRICGKFSYKIVKNLHSEIIEYLNKVIHSILLVSKRFHEHILDPRRASESEKSNWHCPPNLLSFKIGDLMRCKLSSREQEVIRIYNELIRLSRSKEHARTFRIVRIKNRLKDSTNDILINARFNGSILCEIQLAIKSHASDFIKKSNAFHHYIYELERSQFGPVTELCSIWMSLDNRAKVYEDLVGREVRNDPPNPTQKGCRCSDYMDVIKTDQPFICDQCTQIYLHSNYILSHTKCGNCFKYYLCAKCMIFRVEFQVLRDKLLLERKIEREGQACSRKQLRDSCVKLINKGWPEFESGRERYCLSIFIESERVRVKSFKLVFYNAKKYLLGRRENGEFYQIGDINNKYFLKELQAQNLLIQVREDEAILKFDDILAIKEYVLPKLARQSYRKYKESIVLHVKAKHDALKKLDNRECSNILLAGNRPQREKLRNIFAADNLLTRLPCRPEDFPNLESLVLSRNPIESFEGLWEFASLRVLVIENEERKCQVNIAAVLEHFGRLEHLQKLVLSHFEVGSIPGSFRTLKRLKCLELEWCKLQEVDNLTQSSALEKINISHNQVARLPQQLKHLQRLQTLILHNNPLRVSEGLHHSTEALLSHLVNLDLSQCNLTELSLDLRQFSNVEALNLEHNLLGHLESQRFSHLDKLRVLDLSHNELKQVPHLLCCPKLAKFYISYNHIEELPEFMAKMPVMDFKFEGCPIKKISCVEWLKNTLDDSCFILQKFLICYERIPSLSHATFSSKYDAKMVSTAVSDQLSQAGENQDLVQGSHISESVPREPGTQMHLHSDQENDAELHSEAGSMNLQKLSSQSSNTYANTYANTYLKLKKRISSQQSPHSLDENSSSESQADEPSKPQTPLESEQPDSFELQSKISSNLTQANIDQHFSPDEMLVMDFQSKVKHLQDHTLTFKEFNLYYEERQLETPSHFIAMVEAMGYSHSVINIYSGRFDNFKQHCPDTLGTGTQLFYQHLRRDKIPFASIATLTDSTTAQVRNLELKQVPSHILGRSLQKLSIYKASAIPEALAQCLELRYLKIRKSQLPTVPSFLGKLTRLQELDLSKNMIETLQKEIFFELVHLKVLLLEGNRLKEMPEIYRCIRLQKLSVSHNPTLQIIPESMNLLLNLRSFQFQGCPITSVKCASWLTKRIDPEQQIVLECQLSLAKLHNSQELRFNNHYSTHKLFKWSERDEEEVYEAWNEVEENKAMLFQYKFNQQQFLGRFAEQEFIALKFIKKAKYAQDSISYYRQFKVIIDTKFPTAVQKLKQFLLLYGLENTRMTLSQVDFIDLPLIADPHCHLCSAKLEFPFYWLKWEPCSPHEWLNWTETPRFGCRTCVEDPDGPNAYYRYKNNSILLFKKLNMFKMPSDNIGRNLQPKSLDNVNRHNFECFGCKSKYFQRGEPRYLCLGCKTSFAEKKDKFMDLCKGCVQRLANRDQKLMNKMRAENHQHWHPFLRILFNTEGYYNY